MKPQSEYLTINQLAERLEMSRTQVRQMAKSKRLRSIKGAVIDVNMGNGKYEILKINVNEVIRIYEASFKTN